MSKSRVPHILTSAVFVALLVSTRLLALRYAPPPPSASASHDSKAALSRYGFDLQEVSRQSGITFIHQAPTLDAKLQPIMPEIASMGAAVSVVDFDKDHFNDLYVTNSGEGSKNHLYRNRGDGTFEDVAEKLGIADVNQPGTGVSMGAVWGDYDNDGYPDLFLYKWGRPELFHNEQGKGFRRVTDGAGLPKWCNANSAIWLDYDGDGKLDLFLGGYYRDDLDLWHLKDTKMMPESFEYATNGGRKYLFHNEGNGKFRDVTDEMGLDSHRWALAAAAADLRGTGRPDLVIANDYGVSEIWANEGGKHFREIGRETGVAERPKSGMNISFGDIQNSGKFAMYVSNITEPGILNQGNNLWIQRDRTSGDGIRYDNMAEVMGVALGGWSFGAQFGDFNNDGNVDLFVTNGYISADRDSYWYDYSKVASGTSTIIQDAATWPPIRNRSHSGYQRKHLWLNDGAGQFNDVAPLVGVNEVFDGRSVALVDLRNQGVLDIVVAHQKGPLLIYKNTVAADRNWIDFDLEGTRSNRDAIGAQVRVFWSGQQQLQQISGGSGFCAQNQHRLHFGLGTTQKVDKVEIRWPSGKTQTIQNPTIRTVNQIKEPA